jgi:hypothetical protein
MLPTRARDGCPLRRLGFVVLVRRAAAAPTRAAVARRPRPAPPAGDAADGAKAAYVYGMEASARIDWRRDARLRRRRPALTRRRLTPPLPLPPQVTRHNFAAALPAIRAALAACDFVAIDCEFSGLFAEDRGWRAANGSGGGNGNGGNGNGSGNSVCTTNGASAAFTAGAAGAPRHLDSVEDRYAEAAASATAFSITQFGLSCFVWEPSAGYKARTFNAHVFPRPAEGWAPRFAAEAASLDFLAVHGFDFNAWVKDGVGYLPISFRDARLAALAREERARAARPPIAATEAGEAALVAALRAGIAAWLGGAADSLEGAAGGDPAVGAAMAAFLELEGGGETLLLRSANSFQRALQYQELEAAQVRAVLCCLCARSLSFWAPCVLSIRTNLTPLPSLRPLSPQAARAALNGAGSFLTERVTDARGKPALRLRRAAAEEAAARAAAARAERADAVRAAAGFSLVLEALRDSGKPTVSGRLRNEWMNGLMK